MGKINWSDHLVNIISVILGVTLAFVFDDLANRNYADKEKNRLISDLILELESDLNSFENYQIPTNSEQVEHLGYLVSHMKEGVVSDSLGMLLQAAMGINNHTPSNTIFKLLSETSNIEYISTPELRADLVRFYNEISEEAKARGEMQLDFYQSSIMPSVMTYLDFTSPDPEVFVNAPMIVRNQLIMYSLLIKTKTAHYEVLLEEGNALLEQLRLEIGE